MMQARAPQRSPLATREQGPLRNTGRLCIDFALTGGEGEELARFERLHSPADLAAWLAWCDLCVEGARAGARDLREARRLRWAIWHAVHATIAGEPIPAEHAASIEGAAAPPPLRPRLGGGWADPSARAAMSDIARDAIALLSDPAQRARLRVCAAPDCPVPFYDDSRPGRRRWCEDSRCGDRNRHRAHRARRGRAAG